MRRRRVLAVASTAAVGLAGCTAVRERVGDVLRSPPERRVAPDWRPARGTWAEREYGPRKGRHNPHATTPRTEPSIAWERDLDGSLGDGGLVVVDDTVYLALRRRLLALDAADGALRWEHDIDGLAGLKYVDGRLYQLDWDLREPELVARSLDGDELWRTTVPQQIQGVHEQNGYVFVAGLNGCWTLHADTGQIVRERDEPESRIATTGDSVYAARWGIVVRYDVADRTLKERWQAQSEYATASGQPVVMDDQVYDLQYHPTQDDGNVVVYSPAGERRHGIELDHKPLRLTAIENGLVVSPSRRSSGPLLAIRSDGSRRWTADVSGQASAIAANGTVYAGYPLVALDAESGERLWERDGIWARRLATADSTLYAATTDHRLVALRE